MHASAQVVEDLRRLGVSGVLLQAALKGQLVELRCEMPHCFCPKGRKEFWKRKNPLSNWAPNPDHYPIPRWAKGQLRLDNVRLAHAYCNLTDYGLRTSIRSMLQKGMSLAEIASTLNRRLIRRPHGQVTWAPRDVRRFFVS